MEGRNKGRSVQLRVVQSLPEDATRDDLWKMIDWLDSARRDQATSAKRSFLAVLALAAAFELLRSNTAAQIDVGFLKFDRTIVVLSMIPVLIAYEFFEAAVSQQAVMEMSRAIEQVLLRWSPASAGQGIERITAPPDLLAFSTYSGVGLPQEVATRADRVIDRYTGQVVLLIAAAYLGFMVQCFSALFIESGAGSAVVWIALALTSAQTAYFIWLTAAVEMGGDVTSGS